MRGRLCFLATVGLGCVVGAAGAGVASADSLVVSAPGAKNLAGLGRYLAWAAPTAGGRWKLVVRAPDGTVSTPALASFRALPDPAIGSDRRAGAGSSVVLVYSRCDGRSRVRGCDVYTYDLGNGGEEKRVSALATRAYSETAASFVGGSWVFVRRGGPRPGVYTLTSGSGLRRLSSTVASETASNGSRVAYTFESSRGGGVAVGRASGRERPVVLASGLEEVPRSVVLTRYRAGWLLPEGGGVRAFQTDRFRDTTPVRAAQRLLPATTNSITARGSINAYLDAEGVKSIYPSLGFFAATASAAWRGGNGAIVFVSQSGCQFAPCPAPSPGVLSNGVWRIDPATRALRQLIGEHEGAVFNPAFSRDGRLLFGSSHGLLVTDVDARTRRYEGSLNASDGTWLPDGRLAFSTQREAPVVDPTHRCQVRLVETLRVTRLDPSSPRRLRTATRYAFAPAFASRGRLMAFHGYSAVRMRYVSRLNDSGCLAEHPDAVWVQRVGVPGTGRRVLTLSSRPRRVVKRVAPDFSPDGRRLAVVTSRGVVVMGVDGRDARTLRSTRNAKDIAWSPDGRWLAVSLAARRAPDGTRLVLIPTRGGPRRTLGAWPVGSDCRDCGLGGIAWQALPRRGS